MDVVVSNDYITNRPKGGESTTANVDDNNGKSSVARLL